MQKNQGAKITMYIQMYTLFCYHLQRCQRFLISSALYYVDQKPLTWKDVLLHVVLIDEWVYECLELVIRYLYRSPFWNIFKSTIICYMILLDWSFHFSVKYGYSRMEGDGKFCWWFLCCHCKKIRSDKREPCT